jgi:DNA-binding GntR family transcriptional regulator
VTGTVRQLAGVHPTSAVELATVEIRRCIQVGDLAPGSSFSVAELARQLEVSHIPVREALRKLETEGLVVLSRGRSASVTPLTIPDMQGIYGLRLLIEPELVARSTGLHTPGQLKELQQLLDAIGDPSPQDALRAERDFHTALVRPGASQWDLRTLDQLHTAALRYNWLVFDPATMSEKHSADCVRIHAGILDAVLAGDAGAAGDRLRGHLLENQAYLVERIELLEPTP